MTHKLHRIKSQVEHDDDILDTDYLVDLIWFLLVDTIVSRNMYILIYLQ